VPDCLNTIVAIRDSLDQKEDWRGHLEVAHIDYAWRKILVGTVTSSHLLNWPSPDKAMTDTQLLSLAEMFQDITNSGLTSFRENALCFKQIVEIASSFEAIDFSKSSEIQAANSSASSEDSENSTSRSDFKGLKVTIVRDSIVPWDLRLHNQARSLLSAGAKVSVVGRLEGDCRKFLDERISLYDIAPPPFKQPQLGKEHIWYPVRVLTNLTWTRLLWSLRKYRIVKRLKLSNSVSDTIKRTEADILHIYDVHLAREAFKSVSKMSTKTILDIRDLIAAEGYTAGLKSRLYQRLERKYTSRADKLITVSRASADYLEDKYSLNDISVISNVLPRPARFRPKQSDKVRFLFQGAYRPNRNLLALIRAMEEVRDEAELTFQGWGLMQPLMQLLVKQLQLEDTVHFAKPCSPQDTGEFAKQFDFGVICYSGSTTNLQLTVPVKLFAYLNAGLPVVVSDLPGPRSVLADSLAASYISDAPWEGISKTLKSIVESKADLRTRRDLAYDLADLWSWENEELKYLQICEQLAAEQKT
jgi:glycosyltransferase involved in cell wall biosynthesis